MIMCQVKYKTKLKKQQVLKNLMILIGTNDILPDYIAIKNIALLMICIIKNDGKLYSKIFLEKVLFVK